MKLCVKNIRPTVGPTDPRSDLQFLVIIFFILLIKFVTQFAYYPTD